MSLNKRGRKYSTPGKVPKALSVPDKIKLLKELEGGATYSALADKYGVSRTTVGSILRRKSQLVEQYNEKYKGKKQKQLEKSEYEIIENLVWQFFQNNRSNNVPVSKPLIKLKASEMAETLGIKSFKATDKWLDNFIKIRKIDCKEMTADYEDEQKSTVLTNFEDFSSDCTEPLVKIEPEDFTLTIKVEEDEIKNEAEDEDEDDEEDVNEDEEYTGNNSQETTKAIPTHSEALQHTENLIKYTNEHYPKYLSILSELYNLIEDSLKHQSKT